MLNSYLVVFDTFIMCSRWLLYQFLVIWISHGTKRLTLNGKQNIPTLTSHEGRMLFVILEMVAVALILKPSRISRLAFYADKLGAICDFNNNA